MSRCQQQESDARFTLMKSQELTTIDKKMLSLNQNPTLKKNGIQLAAELKCGKC